MKEGDSGNKNNILTIKILLPKQNKYAVEELVNGLKEEIPNYLPLWSKIERK